MGELIYTIDKDRSEEDNTLVIKIQVAERDGFILKPVKDQHVLTRERLQRLMTAKDTALMPLMIKEEAAYLKKTTGRSPDENKVPFNVIHLSPATTPQVLKLFAMSGKLYCHDKPLVIDLFGKTEFYYTVDTSTAKPVAKGHIKAGAQDFAIESCDFIGRGPPHFYVKGINLKLIATDISWKDLKAAYEEKSRAVPELIEEAEQETEAPRVILNGALSIAQPEPLPMLLLKDRLGAFADLWMNYGDDSAPIPYHDPRNNVERNGQPFCKRNMRSEQGWEKDLLETGFIKKPVGTSNYYCMLDKVAKSLAFLLEIGWQVRDWQGHTVVQQRQVALLAEVQGADILIKGKVHYGNFEADVSTIVGAFNRRERFAEIAPGHVALLPNGFEQDGLDALIEEGEVIGDAIRLKRNNIGALAGLFEKYPQIGLDKGIQQLRDRLDTFQGIATAMPGAGFCGTLRPYQQEGLNWLSFLYDFDFHGFLADDMGLGKTVQVLAFLSRLELSAPVLIVLPTSLIFNWQKEIEKFLPARRVIVHHGPKRQQTLAPLAAAQIILTSYTMARLDFGLLSQLSYACLILDEAQAIKNAHTQTAQALMKYTSRFRLSITGTPVENNLMELWSHFRFLIPDLFGEESAFNAEIQAGMSDPRFLKRIKKKIRPFLLRRRKEDVAKDLPEKIEQVVWIEMQEAQRALYEEFLAGVRRNLIRKIDLDGAGKHRMAMLEAIMRLRQICCHPLLVGGGGEDAQAAVESAKLDALLQDLDTAVAEKRKVLVYSQFTSMLSLIGAQLKARGYHYAYLDGSTQNREKVVTAFQQDPELLIFLISLKAGGVGLNLTAADYVFLYDPWWNAAVENQAIDRAHRIGRHDTVVAKRYIMAESIEEKMMKLKSAKSALAADILDDDGQATAALSSDDLLFLLS